MADSCMRLREPQEKTQELVFRPSLGNQLFGPLDSDNYRTIVVFPYLHFRTSTKISGAVPLPIDRCLQISGVVPLSLDVSPLADKIRP